MLSRRFFLAASAALVPAFTLLPALPALAEETLSVHDAYARSSKGGIGDSGGVFLMLTNAGTADDRLIGARSDVAEKVELHTHKMDDAGVMQMMQIEGGVALPAGTTHAFERGADHIMLLGLTRPLKDGDNFAVTLVFESGAEVTFDVTLDNARKPGAETMKMEEGQDHSKMEQGG